MNWLIVSCSTFDMAGRAMIQGAINGLSKLDQHSHFCSLEQLQHHGENYIGWYKEPEQNEEAFQWADCILDIAGLHTNQGNKYQWMYLRQKYKKPYVYMSQNFKTVDPVLFKCPKIKIIARGQRSANRLRNNGIPCHGIAPDLSFLVEPYYNRHFPVDYPKRVFSTHIIKNISKMYELHDKETDIQIIEKEPQGDTIWEPYLDTLTFKGKPEEYFALVARAEEVHCARYQVACAAILAGIKPTIYGTGNPLYDEKYEDLMDYYGKDAKTLRSEAMLSCEIAWDLVNGIH